MSTSCSGELKVLNKYYLYSKTLGQEFKWSFNKKLLNTGGRASNVYCSLNCFNANKLGLFGLLHPTNFISDIWSQI